MTLARQRPDLSASEEAVSLPFPELAKELRDMLGTQLVAYLGSVRETRAVRLWAEGKQTPHPKTERRLREAFAIARMLCQEDSPAVVQAWFQGLNERLDDRSPARMLREGDLDEVGPQVRGAARAFFVLG